MGKFMGGGDYHRPVELVAQNPWRLGARQEPESEFTALRLPRPLRRSWRENFSIAWPRITLCDSLYGAGRWEDRGIVWAWPEHPSRRARSPSSFSPACLATWGPCRVRSFSA